MTIDDAVDAVIKLNPHPSCYARGRWLPSRNCWEFPLFREPLSRGLAKMHVQGNALLGAVASDGDGYTTCVGLDLDAHLSHQRPGEAAKKFARVACALNVPVVIHSSKTGKGAHIRTLFSEKVPTHLARALYVSLVILSGLSADAAVDKVWPPVQGLGVLALPYNGRMAKQTAGTLALDPWTLKAIPKGSQVSTVLDSEEMSLDDLERMLVSLEVRTDEEARTVSGAGPAHARRLDGRHAIPKGQDQGVGLMVDQCEAVKRLADEAATISYEFWFGMMTNFRPFMGGYDIFSEFSRLDGVRFDDRKMQRSWDAIKGGPRYCHNLDQHWTCPKRAVCDAKSPAGLPFAIARKLRLPQVRDQKS